MTQLNSLPPTEITIISAIGFELNIDTTKFSAFTRNGIVENVKVPKKHKFTSLKSALYNPNACSKYGALQSPDLKRFDRAEQTHFAILAYYEYVSTLHEQPNLNTQEEQDQYYTFAQRINNNYKMKANEKHFAIEGDIEAMVLLNVARFASCSISPMSAFFGGVIAQEIVKFTGKYTPLQQFLHYDIFETLPLENKGEDAQNSTANHNASYLSSG